MNPEVNVPKAIKMVFWRILLFYIGAIIVIGFLVPFNDPNLLKSGTDQIAYSPFTMVLFGSNIWLFQANNFDWFTFITNYMTIPLFAIFYFGYKFVKKTKIVPLMECDFEHKEYKETK